MPPKWYGVDASWRTRSRGRAARRWCSRWPAPSAGVCDKMTRCIIWGFDYKFTNYEFNNNLHSESIVSEIIFDKSPYRRWCSPQLQKLGPASKPPIAWLARSVNYSGCRFVGCIKSCCLGFRGWVTGWPMDTRKVQIVLCESLSPGLTKDWRVLQVIRITCPTP